MSRICIKNLSKSATEKQLQELFGQKGEVTDIKVLKMKGGQVRRMAFVGYRTEAQAQEAQRYFHNTFMGMSRIAVEIAKKYEKRVDAPHVVESNQTVAFGDDEATREPSATMATGSPSVLKTSKSEGIIGKKKAEFIALMRNRSNTSRWTNDDGQASILDPDLSSDEHASDIDDDDDDVNYKLVTDEGAAASTQDGDGSEHARPLSDMDYLRSKVRRHSSSQSDSEADEEHDEHDANNKEVSGAADEEKDSQPYRIIPEEGPMEEETTRLFVKNLPFSCSEEEFRWLLEPFGPVEVHLPLDADKRGKGFGFAEYMLPDHAALACAQLSGEAFQGRVLHVTKANRRIEKVVEVAGTSSQLSTLKTSKLSSFQQKKEEERRKFLSRKEGWNASFVRSDTVVDALADRHGVSSADILDTSRSGGHIAVRLAVGESNIIQENRDFLSSSGIDVAVLESHHSSHKGSTRSTTSFLVKNLPPNSQSDELESMFARYGNCSCSMAPSKTLLLVEFIEPSEARAALKGLAYRNYKHSPLYLEWAPLSNAANGNVVKKKDHTTTVISVEQETASSSSFAVESLRLTDEDKDKDNQYSYSTLFVKNINFSTTEDALRSHLESLGVEGLRTVLIQKKMVGSHLLSQGYGFVEFRSAESAARSLVRMNGSLLDSHALEVKPSDKRVSAAPTQAILSKSVLSGGVNKLNSRIVVRNVAFQSTKAEIRSLFSSFGSVQTVRMPKKMGGEHRGFAFVEFSTAQEAAQAMASLRNTHLYGRHLVLEWAKDDDQDEFQVGGSKTATSGASAFNAVQAPAGVTASGAAIDKLRRRARQDVQAIAAQQKRRKVEDVLDSSHMVTADDI